MKQQVFEAVAKLQEEISCMTDAIYDHPELGHEEFFAAEQIENMLVKHGFTVEKGLGGVPTALRAVYESGTGGPSVGLLCEMDALANLGHACGHHLQSGVALGAAIALKDTLDGKMPFKLVVYTCPDEEGHITSGKKELIEAGYLRDVDLAIISHAGAETTTDLRTLAMRSYIVRFYGKGSHAGAHPEQGRSAFDGLQLAFHGIEFMREHIPASARIHYTIDHAGHTPSNIVPDSAQGQFVLRAMKLGELDDICERFHKVVKGAALATGTTYEIDEELFYPAKFPIMPLADCFYDNAEQAGCQRIDKPRTSVGSTDFSFIMQRVPALGIRIEFAPKGTGAHSREWLECGKQPCARDMIRLGGSTMAGMAYDFITNETLRTEIRQSWQEELALQGGN